MHPLSIFIIKSSMASGIFYFYYHLALRNKKFHIYNRFYLLMSLTISLVAPFVNINLLKAEQAKNIPLQSLFQFITQQQQKLQSTFYFNTDNILIVCMFSISIVFLIILGKKICWIYKIKKYSKQTPMNGFTFIETNARQAPFSFFNNLFWKNGVPVNNVFGEKIFKHELIHIKQKHTYDKLFIQLSTCVFWINPFFWLIQKELNTILEFIADEASVEEGDTETFAIMLLQTYNDGVYLNPISSFLNSSIKRRLNMITASKKVQYSYLRRVCGLPILLLVTILVSAKIANAQTDPKLMPNASVKITKTKVLKVNDSLVNVTINYVDEQEKPTSVNLVTTYAKNDSANEAVIYDGETGERREVSQKETKEIVKQIIQNPPAGIIYYIDNKEFSSEEVKKLAPEKIKTINVFGKEEAVKKFGARAKFGAIVFTTN